MAQHTITVEQAYEIDRQWSNGDGSGLRCVSYRRAGNKATTMLTVPGDDSAPCYQAVNGHFQHITGPTLDEWQAQRDAAELEGILDAEYRDDYETRRDLCAGAVQ